QRWTATRKSRARGLATSGRSVIEASSTRSKASSPPQAGQAGCSTGTSIGGSEDCSGAGASRALNVPRPGSRPGRVGGRAAQALGEGGGLPLGRARQLLDLRLQRRDRGGLLEDQGHQLIASQLGEVGVRHGGNLRKWRPRRQGVANQLLGGGGGELVKLVEV